MKRTLIRLLIWISLAFSTGIFPAMAEADPRYEAALNDYRANRVAESARALRAILLKEPRHREAAMLLATIHFQNLKMKKARALFERGDASLLTAETAFAWGAVYLEFDEDAKAGEGFRYIVKNKTFFRPLAIFHLGVIAYRAGQWQKARRYLQKVRPRDLPVEYRINRRRYLADIQYQQNRLLESVTGNAVRGDQDMSTSEVAVPMVQLDEDTLENLKAVTKPAPARPWRFVARPQMTFAQKNLVAYNHGLARDRLSLFAHREEVNGLASYGDERKSGLVGGLAYSVGSISHKAKLDEVRYFRLDQSTGLFTSQVDSSTRQSSGFLNLQPYVSLRGESLRLDLSTGVRSYFPDYNAQKAWGQTSEQIALRNEDDATEIGLELTAQQPFDRQQNKVAMDLGVRTYLGHQFEDMRLNLEGYSWDTDQPDLINIHQLRLILADPKLRSRVGFNHEHGASLGILFNIFSDSTFLIQFETLQRGSVSKQNRVSRPRSTDPVEAMAYGTSKVLGSLNVPMGHMASVTASVAYNHLSDYHYTAVAAASDGSNRIFSTDVEQLIHQAGLVVSATKWLRLSGSYTMTTHEYVRWDARDPEFRRNNPDSTANVDIYVELSQSF